MITTAKLSEEVAYRVERDGNPITRDVADYDLAAAWCHAEGNTVVMVVVTRFATAPGTEVDVNQLAMFDA